MNTISFGLNSLSDIDPLESNDNGINVVEEVSADSSHKIDNI